MATRAARARREDARAAVEAAGDAFPAWSMTTPGERSQVLSAAAQLLDQRAPEIALRSAAAQAYAMNGETIPSDIPGLTALAVRAPAGVVVGMAPWKAPAILAARAIATPLAFGNTVVLKASERCPRVHAAVADAGVPKGVVNFLTHASEAASEVVDELIADPRVRRVNFTGSTGVGRIIAVRRTPQALSARARRQGSVGRPRRRRSGRGGRRRDLRGLHELHPDSTWSVAGQIQSGICHTNGPTVHDEPQMPFGGVKDSGWGRFGGKAALDELTELRWLTMQRGPRHYPI